MINKSKYLSPEIWLSESRIVCGLMSGTSLDGVDAALVRFSAANDRHKMEFLGFYYLPFDEKLKNKIIALISDTIHIRDVSELHFSISNVYYEAVINLCQKLDFRINNIDLIGMHGQTVWHEPKPDSPDRTASSLQLGS
ncbi:anhydro-N-acetylmuramic acid kinase, partial [Bacteroidota bacterium]